MVRHTACIGVVKERIEAGGIVQKAIEYEGSFAYRCPDHAGVKRSVLTEQKGIDLHPGIRTVFCVNHATAAVGGEELAV